MWSRRWWTSQGIIWEDFKGAKWPTGHLGQQRIFSNLGKVNRLRSFFPLTLTLRACIQSFRQRVALKSFVTMQLAIMDLIKVRVTSAAVTLNGTPLKSLDEGWRGGGGIYDGGRGARELFEGVSVTNNLRGMGWGRVGVINFPLAQKIKACSLWCMRTLALIFFRQALLETTGQRFWEMPVSMWDTINQVGLR